MKGPDTAPWTGGPWGWGVRFVSREPHSGREQVL